MKLAVMSDVHANPKALETALADARGQGCERFVMLGDVTGYGYDAKTALDVVRGTFDAVLMGNHDSACAGLEPEWEVLANRNYIIDCAERETLGEADVRWLKSREYLRSESGAAFAHGCFDHPSSWGYIISPQDAARSLSARTEDGICYVNLSGYVMQSIDEAQRAPILESLSRSILSLSGVEEVQYMVDGESAPQWTMPLTAPESAAG